jgi:hypothetical protein
LDGEKNKIHDKNGEETFVDWPIDTVTSSRVQSLAQRIQAKINFKNKFTAIEFAAFNGFLHFSLVIRVTLNRSCDQE